MDCNLLGSSVQEIFQARILERVAISFSRRSSPPRDGTHASCTGRQVLHRRATREAPDPRSSPANSYSIPHVFQRHLSTASEACGAPVSARGAGAARPAALASSPDWEQRAAAAPGVGRGWGQEEPARFRCS